MDEKNQHERPVADGRKTSSKCRRSLSVLSATLSRYKGFAFGFGSACCYACSTVTVSRLSDDISTSGLAFARTFVSAFLSLIILCYKGVNIRVSFVDEFKLHLGLSVLGVVAIWCQFYAYQNMPPADACAIIYSYLALNGLLARIFFKEPFGCFEIILVFSTFCGVVLVSRPPFLFDRNGSTFKLIPPLVALSGTISVSLTTIFMRAMGRQNIHPLKIVFWCSLLSIIYLIIPTTLLKEWSLPCDVGVALRVLAVCILAFLGLTLLNYALAELNTVYVSILSMNEVYIVFLLDIIFFGFQPQWVSVIGMFIITVSSTVIPVRKALTSSGSNQSESEKGHNDDDTLRRSEERGRFVLPEYEKADYSVIVETEEAETKLQLVKSSEA